LEKFKFVLDYKIKDLKEQVAPRELDLLETREIVKKMEVELQRFFEISKTLNLIEVN